MIVSCTKKNGIILKTSGKYCAEDIIVRPDLPMENKIISVKENGRLTISTGDSFYGMTSIYLTVNVPVDKMYANAEGVKF